MKRLMFVFVFLALAGSGLLAAPVCTDTGTQIVCTATFDQALGDILPLTIDFPAFDKPGYSLRSVQGLLDSTINATFNVLNQSEVNPGPYDLSARSDVYLYTGSTLLASAQPKYLGSASVPNDGVYHEYTGSGSATGGVTYTGAAIPAMYFGPGTVPYTVKAYGISSVSGYSPYSYNSTVSTSGTASLIYEYVAPEPASLALIGTGLLGLGLLLRRKSSR